MAKTVIKVENITKEYELGLIGSGSIREVFASGWNRLRGRTPKSEGVFRALDDISFEVKQGEVVGIIGRNGAGKSTLLKVLSRITEPSKGRIEINGRIASLLEVGTGFHPELTGRENIFLNGSILGMGRKEIRRKFDEIVAFSGIEKFIDTPVKRYSSGMYVRLAFAVAAHLEPEILVIDEVLAVGDAEFQRKCLTKMDEVAKGGRTILFVSHNIGAVQNLCTHGIVLQKGQMVCQKTDVHEAVNHYLSMLHAVTKTELSDRADRQGEGKVRITDFKLFDRDTQQYVATLISGQNVEFHCFYEALEDAPNVSLAIPISRIDGFLVTMLGSNLIGATFDMKKHEKGMIVCSLEHFPLMEGEYIVNFTFRSNGIIQDWVIHASTFSVENGDFFKTGRMVPNSHQGVLFEQSWQKKN